MLEISTFTHSFAAIVEFGYVFLETFKHCLKSINSLDGVGAVQVMFIADLLATRM